MSKLSVIVITKNEEADIGRCLHSVRWADEIIVLDSGSTDKTIEICKQYTPLVIETDWPGFGKQKNRALAQAKCPWILSLDADEWVDENLKQEILARIQDNQDYTYSIPRKSFYCGKLIKYGHWQSDAVLRLFKQGAASFTEDNIHEHLITIHRIKKMQAFLLHNSFASHKEVLDKLNSYSSLTAKVKTDRGESGGLAKAIIHGLWAFFRSYILQLGLLDGKAGFMLAVSFAEGSYYRYLKIMEYTLRREF